MNAPARKSRRRRHPLAHLVVALGIGLVITLMLLVLAVRQIGTLDLDAIYAQGMAQGHQICLSQGRGLL